MVSTIIKTLLMFITFSNLAYANSFCKSFTKKSHTELKNSSFLLKKAHKEILDKSYNQALLSLNQSIWSLKVAKKFATKVAQNDSCLSENENAINKLKLIKRVESWNRCQILVQSANITYKKLTTTKSNKLKNLYKLQLKKIENSKFCSKRVRIKAKNLNQKNH